MRLVVKGGLPLSRTSCARATADLGTDSNTNPHALEATSKSSKTLQKHPPRSAGTPLPVFACMAVVSPRRSRDACSLHWFHLKHYSSARHLLRCSWHRLRLVGTFVDTYYRDCGCPLRLKQNPDCFLWPSAVGFSWD